MHVYLMFADCCIRLQFYNEREFDGTLYDCNIGVWVVNVHTCSQQSSGPRPVRLFVHWYNYCIEPAISVDESLVEPPCFSELPCRGTLCQTASKGDNLDAKVKVSTSWSCAKHLTLAFCFRKYLLCQNLKSLICHSMLQYNKPAFMFSKHYRVLFN